MPVISISFTDENFFLLKQYELEQKEKLKTLKDVQLLTAPQLHAIASSKGTAAANAEQSRIAKLRREIKAKGRNRSAFVNEAVAAQFKKLGMKVILEESEEKPHAVPKLELQVSTKMMAKYLRKEADKKRKLRTT